MLHCFYKILDFPFFDFLIFQKIFSLHRRTIYNGATKGKKCPGFTRPSDTQALTLSSFNFTKLTRYIRLIPPNSTTWHVILAKLKLLEKIVQNRQFATTLV